MGRIKDLGTEAFSTAGDDFEDLDGLTNGSRKIRPINKIGGFVNARANLDVVSFDGATAGARIYWPVTGFGGGKITVPIIVSVPSTNPAATKVLWWTSSSPLTYTSTAAWAMRMTILTTGAIDLRLTDAASVNSRTLTVTANLVSSFAGQKVFIHFTWDGLTAPVIYVNGISQATTETTAGSAPAWSTVIDEGYFGIGSINSSGNLLGSIVPFGPTNGVLSAAEIFAHVQTGRLPAWCEVGTGSMVAQTSGTLKIGWKYRISSYIGADVFTNVGAASNATGVEFIATGTTPTTWVSSSQLLALGPVVKPVIQPIAILADSGSNKIAGVLTAGVTPITDKRDWIIQALTNTSGNQQILGASVFFDFLKVIIADWWINNGGTSKTVSLGNASAGAQYQSAGTFAAGRTKATLLTQVPATNNLWVNSNGTDNLQHTIRGYMVD